MASAFQNSVAEALAEQSWWVRRKDTLTAVAGTILQVGNLLILVSGGWPAWVNAIIAGVIGAAQIVIHAGTKGAITPSMASRLEQAGERAYLDRPSVSGFAVTDRSRPVEAVETEDLPVYEGESSAVYEGQHRRD